MAFSQSFNIRKSNLRQNISEKGKFFEIFSRVVLLQFVSAILIAIAGFVVFDREIDKSSASLLPDNVDGIVVLTGGADRLQTAYELMDAKRAKRLLISGVHPDTSHAAILNALGRKSGNLNCCVDLDHAALDTRGNADQTMLWVQKNNFDSLIVVTSDYHLPRSLMEIQNELPAVKLYPYQAKSIAAAPRVVHADIASSALQLKLKEYVKWVAALARINLENSYK